MSNQRSPAARRWLPWAVLGLALGVTVALGVAREGWLEPVGDVPTYEAMTESLVEDGDLRFGSEDRTRARRREGVATRPLILQRTERGIFYSKPPVYPLLAAPFYAVAGPAGLALLNLLAMVLAVALAACCLRRLGSGGRADWALATFLGAGVLPAYVAWLMSDALQVSLVLAGGALCLAPVLPVRAGGTETPRLAGATAGVLGGVLLALMTAMRIPNGVLAVVVLAACWRGDRRRALQAGAGFLAALALAAGLSWALTGAVNPYGAERASFSDRVGLPRGPAEFDTWFDEHPATHHLRFGERFAPVVTLYSTFYFLVGRHTGLLAYLPAALVLVWLVVRGRQRSGWLLLAGAAALAIFYLLWTPRNYFGGGTFLGNRYFLTAYPLLLLALPRLPRPRVWIVPWVVALLGALSAGVSLARTPRGAYDSQSHAYAGLFRLLPYESTAHVVGTGGRDRYWDGDFLRFVDPYARPRRLDFRLRGTARSAELLLATARPADAVHLQVQSRHAGAVLVADGWRGSVRLVPDGTDADAPGLVRLPLGPAWRRHSFWWRPEPRYRVWSVRLRVESPAGQPIPATMRYLGTGRLLEVFSARLADGELPSCARLGGRDTVGLRVANTSRSNWMPGGVAPVRSGWRLIPLDPGNRLAEGRADLPWPVHPGHQVPIRLPIDWPQEEGRYRLIVDLLVPGIAWFSERQGAPLATTVVDVGASGCGSPPSRAPAGSSAPPDGTLW